MVGWAIRAARGAFGVQHERVHLSMAGQQVRHSYPLQTVSDRLQPLKQFLRAFRGATKYSPLG